jgi:hypothetical protein
MLAAVTYQEAAVIESINSRFVPIQVNVSEEAGKPLIERYRQAWTPDLRVLGPDGFEFYRWNGYLPPYEFLPQLLVGAAQAHFRQHDFEQATATYEEVLRRFPSSYFAPEAMYYLAAAKYKHTHESTALAAGWRQLRSRYPDSIWRMRQLQDEPQG